MMVRCAARDMHRPPRSPLRNHDGALASNMWDWTGPTWIGPGLEGAYVWVGTLIGVLPGGELASGLSAGGNTELPVADWAIRVRVCSFVLST